MTDQPLIRRDMDLQLLVAGATEASSSGTTFGEIPRIYLHGVDAHDFHWHTEKGCGKANVCAVPRSYPGRRRLKLPTAEAGFLMY